MTRPWISGFEPTKYSMIQNQDPAIPAVQLPAAPPNESTGLNIDEHVKISDPNTGTVILDQRA